MLPINFGNVYRKYKNGYFIHYPKLKIGEGNGIPLQYSCLDNPMDSGAWQATVHRVAESDMTEVTEYTTHTHTHTHTHT